MHPKYMRLGVILTLVGLALAALTLESGAKVPTFDAAAEKPMGEVATEAVVTTVGHVRGEGVAVLSRDV